IGNRLIYKMKSWFKMSENCFGFTFNQGQPKWFTIGLLNNTPLLRAMPTRRPCASSPLDTRKKATHKTGQIKMITQEITTDSP
ncbi:MAG TPA: hypothetical protein DD400_04920, partial [Rhodospirillaceae bacterium]|nr:hypothetical protein [Rhodospirillaceae bacterium]